MENSASTLSARRPPTMKVVGGTDFVYEQPYLNTDGSIHTGKMVVHTVNQILTGEYIQPIDNEIFNNFLMKARLDGLQECSYNIALAKLSKFINPKSLDTLKLGESEEYMSMFAFLKHKKIHDNTVYPVQRNLSENEKWIEYVLGRVPDISDISDFISVLGEELKSTTVSPPAAHLYSQPLVAG
jgi:hypothetical protein